MPALSTILPLTLRPSRGGDAPAHGWFLSGKDPADWLRELQRVSLPLEAAKVMVFPEAQGALFTFPAGTKPTSPPRAVPFTCMHGVLWLPCDAVLTSALQADEIRTLCPWAAVVWHPAFPPAAFESGDILPVSALVRRPPSSDFPPWTATVPVDPMTSEVRAVRLAVVFDPHAIFGGEEKLIGSDPPKDLPRPGQPGPRGGGWKNWIAAAMSASRRRQPGTAPRTNPLTVPAAQQPLHDLISGWEIVLLTILVIYLIRLAVNDPSVTPYVIAGLLLIALVVYLLLKRRVAKARRREAAHGGFSGQTGPAQGAGGAAAGRFRQWLQRVSAEMERRRYKAVEDLLEELDRDPDKALRRALPLGGGALHRGVAAPGDTLQDGRIPDFSLGKLDHSGPVDDWNLPAAYQQRLRARYVSLAQAEVQRGRHRSAAYIHAHLLGDLVSAAATLRAGGFLREAATLYRTRLSNPVAAAECLAAAGCHVEAAELYEETGRWLQAGDAFALGGLQDRAAGCFRKAVQERIDRYDLPGAAALLETKLEEPAEALQLLQSAWPGHHSAATSLIAAYDLMARRRWTVTALEYTHSLTTAPPPPGLHEMLAKILTGLARAWPHETVRETAKEGALKLIAAKIGVADVAAMRRAGALLAELEPGDKLLSRDVARFTSAAAAAARKPASSSVTRPLGHAAGTTGLTIEHRDKIRCDAQRPLGAFPGQGNEFFVLFFLEQNRHASLSLAVGDWHEKICPVRSAWPGWRPANGVPALAAGPRHFLMLNVPGVAGAFGDQPPSLHTIDRANGPSLTAGQPAWMHHRRAHVTVCGDLWCLASDDPSGGVLLEFVDADGTPRQNLLPVTDFGEPLQGPVAAIAAHGRFVVIAVPAGLSVWDGRSFHFFGMRVPPQRLAAAPSWLAAAFAVSSEYGAYLFTPQDGQMLTIDSDIARPVIGFTGRGHVVALSATEGIAARAGKGLFTRFQRFPWKAGAPLSLLSHPDGDNFGVLTSSGVIEILQISDPAGR